MKKLIIFIVTILYANIAQNILGDKYFKYQKLITSSLEENASIEQTLIFLENNGLINLTFNKKKIIHPTFIFLDNNPIFNTKTLYNSLENLGYIKYYPINLKKDNKFSITLELNQSHFINPLNIIEEFKKRGCEIVNIKKEKNFTYFISCKKENIPNAYLITKKLKFLHNIKGIYWLKTNNFKKIFIKNFSPFYPYIILLDKNLNILNAFYKKNPTKKLIITIPKETFYIKIQDYFTNANLTRGLLIKGLK